MGHVEPCGGGIALGQTPITRIAYPATAEAAVRFAAEELQRYLGKTLDVTLEVGEGGPSAGSFFLATAQLNPEALEGAPSFQDGEHDRCAVFDKDGCVLMVGENAVSTLYAVYDFLQAYLDVRFFAPGEAYEHVPKRPGLRLKPPFVFHSGSRFAIRDWVNRTNSPEVMAFAAKNRVNTILGCGSWNPDFGADRGSAENAAIVHELGLKLRGPGHVWRLLVPDGRLFGEHPEYFPMIDGKRTVNNRTACFSNARVQAIFYQNLRGYLRANPYWDIFAFWPEDTNDPYYCGCPECRKMGMPDWYLTLANGAAEILEEELPHASLELIAYFGTRNPPTQVKALRRDGRNMLVNFCLGNIRDLYSPAERKTYGNAEVAAMYHGWRDYLAEVGFKGRTMLMEYYNLCEWPNQGPRGRSLLWPMETIGEDTRFYLRDGLDGLGAFTGFDRLAWPSPFNMWCWTRLRSRPETTVEALKDDFYPKYFGALGPAARRYMDCLEAAMDERTSPQNIMRVKALSAMLDPLRPAEKQLAYRLGLLRIHHGYCVLAKEIFQAFIDGDLQRWQELEKPYLSFFEERRAELEGSMAPFPPLWAKNWSFHAQRSQELIKDTRIR